VNVTGTLVYSHIVLHWSGLSKLTMLEVVVLVVVGMLVKCLGPYVDRHVVSKAVEVASYDMRVDCGQPIATDSIQMRDRHCA
jgi:hypothetical protein